MIRKFIHLGFNIWKIQIIEQSHLLKSKNMDRMYHLKIYHTNYHIVNTVDIEILDKKDFQAIG